MCLNFLLIVIITVISRAGVQHTDLDSVLKRGLDKGFEYNKSILRGSQTKSDPPEPRDSLSSSALLPPAAERSQNLFAKGGIVCSSMHACLSGEMPYFGVSTKCVTVYIRILQTDYSMHKCNYSI